MNECGFLWGKVHECTELIGHVGSHVCEEHYGRCCTDCTEAWSDPCGAVLAREAVAA